MVTPQALKKAILTRRFAADVHFNTLNSYLSVQTGVPGKAL
ncbi:hypothetical protein [Methylobacillus caricis]|nr:hypothetical protein [Methylobacillus caricis]